MCSVWLDAFHMSNIKLRFVNHMLLPPHLPAHPSLKEAQIEEERHTVVKHI